MKTLIVEIKYQDEDTGQDVLFPVAIICPFDTEPKQVEFNWRVIERHDGLLQ